jgi:tripartite-type tricarboxylate transporter receptor subunit TctC
MAPDDTHFARMMEIAMTDAMQLRTRVTTTLLAILLSATAAPLLIAGATSAQTWPSKLIKVICPIPAGSVVDVNARLVTPELSARLGTPVVVDNRPGGGGTTGTKEFARAVPDGHTLLFSGLSNVFAFKALEYDPVKDVVPIGMAATHHWILVVSPRLPAKSLKELVEHAKANPGKLNWGFGQGTTPQMFGELFKASAGIDVGSIPYKSGTQAIPDLLAGRIDMNFGTVSNLLPLIREGKLRALAVSSAVRSPDLPDVPTMAESGFPHLTRGAWVGLWGPAGTPAHIVSRLNAEINASVTTPAMKAAMKNLDFEPKYGSPQDFTTFIINEMEAWTPAAKAAGIIPK